MMKKTLLLALMFVALLPLSLMAQSPNMMAMAQAELQKRGLTESEVRTRLLSEGIDVDNIPPTEYANYQSRITNILNKMQAEKAAQKAAATAAAPSAPATETSTSDVSSPSAAGTQIIATAANEADTPNEFPQTTAGEAAAEEALESALQENHVSTTAGDDIYGHSLFTGTSMDVFRTTDGAQAPDTYVLGDGDEIHISIFGSSQTEIHQRIAADGSIQPAGSTKIFLKGMTLGQARTAIINKLSQHYSFRSDQIAVTITTARTISVSIYGEVGVQGGFTLSALNTAFNALAAAGGPTAIGSIRNIQRSRAGKTDRLDLYQYMKGNTKNVMFDLQNNDVLFVPVADNIVRIEGAVRRPMRYEMIEGETLKDLIEYAGGLTYNVFPDFIQIERRENDELKYLEFNLEKVMSGKEKVAVKGGDVVRIRTSNRPMENYITIRGDVYYGGNFDLEQNNSLLGLLEKAQLKYTARKDIVIVERTSPDETVEFLTVPFPGENGNPDFKLQARDQVRVLSLVSFRDVDEISVQGQVRAPFTRTFGLNDRMTVAQAIEYAHGLKQSVFPVAYIVRRDLTNPVKRQYIRVDLDKDGETLLQPGDRLNIYDNTTYTNVGEVRVSGAVKNPVGTTYDPSLTVHDLLMMAGGFEVGAAYDRVEVFRVNISKKDEVELEQITLAVDENYNLVENKKTPQNFQLQPYDHIVVRMTPNYTQGRTVEVNGRVKYPGVYVLEDNKTQLWEVIKMAGGLLDDADPYARLFRTQGRNTGNIGLDLRRVKRHRGSLKDDPILMNGDVINIVRQENTVVIREIGTRMAQYVPSEYASTQKTLVYQGRHTASWYVKHFAGGFDKMADRNSVTVTMPNNQSDGTKWFLFFRRTPRVEPGGVITMRMDQEKREKEEKPKEKIDWGAEARNSLAALTSVVSIILLVRNLK
ncbi:MAG: SLBB domain-containing protein [Bacteroidales bacterium]|nr:SLBB domain-containing protein [Bacteroidales bacterium]